MQTYFDSAQDEKGNALGGAQVNVYLAGTTTPATIYSDNGVTLLANPFAADGLGGFFFRASNGLYKTVVSYKGATYTKDNILLFDPADAIPGSVVPLGAKGDGVTDDTAAFVAALATGQPVYLPEPSVAYIVGDCTLPSGATIFGYGGANYSSIVAGPVVRRKAGCTSIFKEASGAKNIRLSGFTIDGVDRTCNGVVGAADGTSGHMVLDSIDIRNCNYGLGDDNYIHTVKTSNCNFVLNNYGVRNPIDGIFLGGFVASNQITGIFCGTGADSNTFVGVKAEWNLNYGFDLFGATRIAITGGVIDRNYFSGVRIAGAAKHITINGPALLRNGRADVAPTFSHIRIQDTASDITINGCVTRTGADDGGGGPTTPQYAIDIGAATVDRVTIVGNDLTGTTVADGGIRNTVASTNILASGNQGAMDVELVQSIVSAAGTTTLDLTTHAVVVTGSTTQTLTLPACRTGRKIKVINRSTGTVTVNRSGSDTINGGAGGLSVTTGQMAELYGNGITDWVGKAY